MCCICSNTPSQFISVSDWKLVYPGISWFPSSKLNVCGYEHICHFQIIWSWGKPWLPIHRWVGPRSEILLLAWDLQRHQPLVHAAPNGSSDDTNCGKPNDKLTIFLKKTPPTYPIYESFMPLLRMVYWSYLSMYQPSPGPTDSLGDVPIPKLDVRDHLNHLSRSRKLLLRSLLL